MRFKHINSISQYKTKPPRYICIGAGAYSTSTARTGLFVSKNLVSGMATSNLSFPQEVAHHAALLRLLLLQLFLPLF